MSILDNLNSLSKKAQGYADIAVDKAKDLAEVAADKAKTATNTAKLNMAILSEQRELQGCPFLRVFTSSPTSARRRCLCPPDPPAGRCRRSTSWCCR